MEGHRDRLLEPLLGCLLLSAGPPTLIVYRAAIQPDYKWGMWGINGEGMSPGIYVVLLCVAIAWLAFVLGTRGARTPFAALLILWNGWWLGAITLGIARVGASALTLRGDAWGVRIPFAVVGPLLFGGLLALSLAWYLRRRKILPLAVQAQAPRRVASLTVVAVVLAPVTVILFSLGDGVQHTNYDRAAVLLVVAQIVLVGSALNPKGNRIPGSHPERQPYATTRPVK
jgi:hypothetical protein